MAETRRPILLLSASREAPPQDNDQGWEFGFETQRTTGEELAIIQLKQDLAPQKAASILRAAADCIEANPLLLNLQPGEKGSGAIRADGRILLGFEMVNEFLNDIARIVDGASNRERLRAVESAPHDPGEWDAEEEQPASTELQAPGVREPA